MPTAPPSTARDRLRGELREARRRLAPVERAAADRAILARVQRLGVFRNARRIAVYFAFDGEPRIDALVRLGQALGKRVVAPVLMRRDLGFVEVRDEPVLTLNRLGIEEPAAAELVDPRCLDLVLTPLVAFDDRGVRLGVGGGYYDRCFRHLNARRAWRRPKLVGIGYELQHVEHLEREAWDVPLWGAVTEARAYRFG